MAMSATRLARRNARPINSIVSRGRRRNLLWAVDDALVERSQERAGPARGSFLSPNSVIATDALGMLSCGSSINRLRAAASPRRNRLTRRRPFDLHVV